MNIFVLDTDPGKCAAMHCDKHVVKMILESVQMLSTVINLEGGIGPYKSTHKNHPCTKWVRESHTNFMWLYCLTSELNSEFKLRFKGVSHKSWLKIKSYSFPELPDIGLTTFAQAMPDKYKNPDAVTAYRNYYLGEKARFAKWTNRKEPSWWKSQFSSV